MSAMGDYQEQADEQLSLADFTTAFKRRWYIIAILVGLSIVIGLLWYKAVSRQYTATSTVNVNPPDRGGTDLLSTLSGEQNSNLLETEAAVLQSDSIAEATINRLSLTSNPDFMKPTYLNTGGRRWEDNPSVMAQALSTWKSSIKVEVLTKTNLVRVSVTTRNPVLSRDVSNALVESYIRHNYASHYEIAQQASEWLTSQLTKLRDSAQDAQRQLLDYQRASGLISADKNGTLQIEPLTDLTRSLVQAESDRIVAEGQYRMASATDRDVMSALYSDPILQSLSTERATIEQQTRSDASLYGAKYPKMVDELRHLADIDRASNQRVDQLREALKRRMDVAVQAEASVRARLNEAKSAANSTSNAAVQLSLKEKEVEAADELYRSVSSRLQAAGVSAGLAATNLQPLDHAHVPAAPSYPVFSTFLLGSTFLGFIGGLIAAYVTDKLLDRVDDDVRVENILHTPVLGTLPKVAADSLLHPETLSVGSVGMERDGVAYIESCRAIRTAILLSDREGKTHSIVITSGRPGEGKSTVAENLAYVFANKRHKILLIDGDLRRPVLGTRLGITEQVGLVQILEESTSLDKAVLSVPYHENLFFLPTGLISPQATELLTSERMRVLLSEARDKFFMTIIDTPPLLFVTDAAVLADMADQMIVVVRAGLTRERSLRELGLAVRRANLKIDGSILNGKNTSKQYYADYYEYQRSHGSTP